MSAPQPPLWLDATHGQYHCHRCPALIPEGQECAWLPETDELLCRDCGIDAEDVIEEPGTDRDERVA